jgi:hypothetical protein
MANAKGHLKLTGDTHLPDVETDLAIEEGASSLARLARERTQPGRANTAPGCCAIRTTRPPMTGRPRGNRTAQARRRCRR